MKDDFEHFEGKPRKTSDVDRVKDVELFAWVGEDELGSGEVGLKQGHVPAGLVPLAAIKAHEQKMRRLKPQLEHQAKRWGKRIYLCRFTFVEIVDSTEAGS
jgi:hypothetical protein